ncbi:MAG: FkbM family methyltransferase [Planctomycetes bacterium]|nr:FkbM family methyltransferase [Planctomycetota bacterium]
MKPLLDNWRSRLHWQLLQHYHQRIRRRVFQFKADCILPTTRFGSPYGGWVLIPEALALDSIIYSFGIGEDISFDRELLEACGGQIHGFDPTPKAIAWLKQQTLPQNYFSHFYGLAEFDGEAVFMPPAEAEYTSYAMTFPAQVNQGKAATEVVTAPVKRLVTIMKVLGHTRIDLLKMDIEGAEYAVINDILRSDLRPRQWLIEFHHRGRTNLYQTWLAVRSLRRCGWQLFHVSDTGYEFSFIDRRARGRRLP